MFTNTGSTFFNPLYVPDPSQQSAQGTDASYDLITFLAVIQKLRIGILPITWQPARQVIGAGASSRIKEALINHHTSFAFKCVQDNWKATGTEGTIIRTLINEILVLGHASVRKHPNIVELQGVCWDVVSDERGERVWPVLVFEKAQYGDLYNFATLPVGRDLCIAERLKLCMDVGTAISDMQSNSGLSAGQ